MRLDRCDNDTFRSGTLCMREREMSACSEMRMGEGCESEVFRSRFRASGAAAHPRTLGTLSEGFADARRRLARSRRARQKSTKVILRSESGFRSRPASRAVEVVAGLSRTATRVWSEEIPHRATRSACWRRWRLAGWGRKCPVASSVGIQSQSAARMTVHRGPDRSDTSAPNLLRSRLDARWWGNALSRDGQRSAAAAQRGLLARARWKTFHAVDPRSRSPSVRVQLPQPRPEESTMLESTKSWNATATSRRARAATTTTRIASANDRRRTAVRMTRSRRLLVAVREDRDRSVSVVRACVGRVDPEKRGAATPPRTRPWMCMRSSASWIRLHQQPRTTA